MTREERAERFRAKQRAVEAARIAAGGAPSPTAPKPKRQRRKPEARPVFGSQQWAETYRDDLGESHD